MTKLAVIDADTPAFASAISCEDYYYEDADGNQYRRKSDVPAMLKAHVVQKWEATAPANFAVARTKKFIEGILEDAGCDDYVCFVGGGNNYRYDLPCNTGFPYKGNREEMHTPFYLDECKNYIVECHPTVVCDGYEADDGCGILMYSGMGGYDELVLCHIDKDMDMIAGHHMRWSRSISGRIEPAKHYTITEEEALRNFYRQLLSGDTTDNIPGYYKLTGKRLMKTILAPLDRMKDELDMWEYVAKTYAKAGVTDISILIEIGRLLWIQREENQLWLPPTMR